MGGGGSDTWPGGDRDRPVLYGASTEAPAPPAPEGAAAALPVVEPSPVPAEIAERYERREPLGEGGMGVVWRCWDRRLNRPVALKTVRSGLLGARALARFEVEVHVTTRLQHPGIVPVHDLGRLDDGRLWFAMKEVRGRTLEALVTEAHAAWRVGREGATFGFRRILEGFLRVCETVAYAHARGVVHRDLKPQNVMVGDFGEVLVLDWGLARVLDGEAPDHPDPIELGRQDGRLTEHGSIAGTPSYMAPEQARGEADTVGPAADVYALGAILYDLLTERPPRLGSSMPDLVRRVAEATPVARPSEVIEGPWFDEELEQICMKALETEPGARYPDAGAFAADLARWLDGSRRRERAMALVEEADDRMEAADRGEDEGHELARRAEAELGALPVAAPAEDKEGAWTLQDQAADRLGEANVDRIRAVQLLRSALSHAPELAEAHDRLADHFRRQHAALEAKGEAARAVATLADLVEHDRSERYTAYVRGTGAIDLVTDPPGATVQLHRLVEEGRRLVPRHERTLGTTPLRAAPLQMGSYLLVLQRAGHDDVRYPVSIRREERWDGVPPGEAEPFPIRLPRTGELGPDDCYVPAGWSWSGDDEFATTLPLRRTWMGPLVVRRFPVTLEEYAAFLNDLVERGEEARAVTLEPKLSEGAGPFLERDARGRWAGIRTDQQGWLWDVLRSSARLPAVYVDLHQAQAFAAWEAERTGVGWRLPTQLEWQRAARGADPRRYPWGDHFEASWTSCRRADHPHIVSVEEHPVDCSPFGVRGLAGNVLEWAHDGAGAGWTLGGSCSSGPLTCSITYRVPQEPEYRSGRLGFRLVRDFS
jgi:eukaryotic-like serine/threonine-protein kinase